MQGLVDGDHHVSIGAVAEEAVVDARDDLVGHRYRSIAVILECIAEEIQFLRGRGPSAACRPRPWASDGRARPSPPEVPLPAIR
mgnify:CR=1 FL=1